MSAFAWIISIPIAAGLGWLVWYIWNAERTLDQRLAAGDMSLLTSPSHKVTEVIRAPQGSRVDKVAGVAVAPGGSAMVPMRLPDGRVFMVPAAQVMAQQQVQTHVRAVSYPSTMHSNQQPPMH